MEIAEKHPKTFISYAWGLEEENKWVLELATYLRKNGIDAILDQWDMIVGSDIHSFMEQIEPADKVLIICDKIYVEKTKDTNTGVGKETTIIKPELYEKYDQAKFIPVIRQTDETGKAFVPVFIKSLVYVDMSTSELYTSNMTKLVSAIFSKPIIEKPPIGPIPLDITSVKQISVLDQYFRAAQLAIKEHKYSWRDDLERFFDEVVNEISNSKIEELRDPIDEQIMQNIIETFDALKYTMEILELIARQENNSSYAKMIHRFYEKLLNLNPQNGSQYSDQSFEIYQYLICEFFLFGVAVLLKEDFFEGVVFLLANPYVYNDSFDQFSNYFTHFSTSQPEFLKKRSLRLNLSKNNLMAYTLLERWNKIDKQAGNLLQSDLILFLKSTSDLIKNSNHLSPKKKWYPHTLIFLGRRSSPLELFVRAEVQNYFNLLLRVITVNDKNEFELLVEESSDFYNQTTFYGDGYNNLYEVVNLNKLGTR